MEKKIDISKLVNNGIPKSNVQAIADQINNWLNSLSDIDCWQQITNNFLIPQHNFALHQYLYHLVYNQRDLKLNPGPAWFPSEKISKKSNLESYIQELKQELKIKNYQELYNWSIQNKKIFWQDAIKKTNIIFRENYKNICYQFENPKSVQWLSGAVLNIAESCCKPNHDNPAVIFQQEDGKIEEISYKTLNNLSNQVANSLVAIGLKAKDAIAIYMPMTVEAVAIYLGIVKAGCAVVAIADSFASGEIKKRLKIANAKAIFTQDYNVRATKEILFYEKIIEAEAPQAIVIPYNNINKNTNINLRKMDYSWQDFLVSNTEFQAVPCTPQDYTNILFSSGTTGDPKAIPWDHTSPIKAAVDGYFYQDITQQDIIAWPTNLGWMMGPWLVYACFVNKATMALYYGAPTTREFGKFIQDTKTTILGVIPSIVKTWRNNNTMQDLDWKNIKLFTSTGESSNHEDMLYLMSLAGYKPVIEYCGGTEISGGYLTSTVMQPSIPGLFSTTALGMELVIFDENGSLSSKGEVGIIPPSIGLSNQLLNQDHHKIYYADMPKDLTTVPLRRHGDYIEKLENGYYRSLGRADDTMNIGGIKISSAEIENIILKLDPVVEVAVISITPKDNGPDKIVAYVVLEPEFNIPNKLDNLKITMQKLISSKLNPLFKIFKIILIDSLPRTSSNKIMRKKLRQDFLKIIDNN